MSEAEFAWNAMWQRLQALHASFDGRAMVWGSSRRLPIAHIAFNHKVLLKLIIKRVVPTRRQSAVGNSWERDPVLAKHARSRNRPATGDQHLVCSKLEAGDKAIANLQ